VTDFEPKLALFLGAGFSRAWGLPLASEIMDFPPTRVFPGKWQNKLKEKTLQAWQRANKEGCVSIDEFGRRIQESKGLYGLSEEDFTTFLALRLSSFQWHVGSAYMTKWGTGDHVRMQRKIPGCYREFLKGIAKSKLTGILTTNYDLVVEKILGPTSSGRRRGFKYWDDNEPLTGRHPISSRWSYGPIMITGEVPYLKLHGSLNWAPAPERKIIKYIDARPSRGRRYAALIVPPRGSERHALLNEIWHNSKIVLREASVWIFCGYSLPDYDDEVRQLISSNAVEGQRVMVMDKAPEAICEKLRGILPSPRIVVGPPVTNDLKSRQMITALSAVIGESAAGAFR
jgi:hypothetical protein